MLGLTLPELSIHLASKNVEQIRWSGHACDLHIAVLVLTFKFVRGGEDSGILIAKL